MRNNNAELTPKRGESNGGLYSKINISVNTANKMVLSLIALLVAAFVFVTSHNGFTVSFDTGGGTYVAPAKAMYADTVSAPVPEREGYVFKGWYTDRECSSKWDIENDILTRSITLYAGWDKAE